LADSPWIHTSRARQHPALRGARTLGVGYGAETVRLLLGFGFEEFGLHRISGERSPLNEASAKTLTAASMIEEGTIRGRIKKASQWRDTIVHAMLEDEWRP
jgi:ribosomal-protein-alanine N-acetyltransferase